MPVLRDRMHHGGEARAIDVAWVSVPDLTVHRDHQIYEPLGAGRVRFRSPDEGFERVIELTPDGFVRDYPDIARLDDEIHAQTASLTAESPIDPRESWPTQTSIPKPSSAAS